MMHIFLYTYSFDPIKGEIDLINQIVGKEDEV
jgi:hypothetical protein